MENEDSSGIQNSAGVSCLQSKSHGNETGQKKGSHQKGEFNNALIG